MELPVKPGGKSKIDLYLDNGPVVGWWVGGKTISGTKLIRFGIWMGLI